MTATMTEETVAPGRECNKIDPETGEECGESRRSEMVRHSHAFDGLDRECKFHKRNRNRWYNKRNSNRTPEQALAARDRIHKNGMKKCGACKEEKKFVAYGPDIAQPDSLHHRCLECVSYISKFRPRVKARMLSLGIDPKFCIYCGSTKKITLEHIFVGAQGLQVLENVVFACFSCNSSKKGVLSNVYDWLAWRKPKNPHPKLGELIKAAEVALSQVGVRE